jgi:transcription initiation factor TFIID TATA-box-binding protein
VEAVPNEKRYFKASDLDPKILNIVATANLNSTLDLRNIAIRTKNAEYNPKRFSAVVMRIRDPAKSTALVFNSGKMVCTGSKSEEASYLAVRSYAKTIKRVGHESVKLSDFKIQNIVASYEVNFSIMLEAIASS